MARSCSLVCARSVGRVCGFVRGRRRPCPRSGPGRGPGGGREAARPRSGSVEAVWGNREVPPQCRNASPRSPALQLLACSASRPLRGRMRAAAEPRVAEAPHLADDRQQRRALLRQVVLHAGRRLRVAPAHEDLLRLQPAKALGERARADPRAGASTRRTARALGESWTRSLSTAGRRPRSASRSPSGRVDLEQLDDERVARLGVSWTAPARPRGRVEVDVPDAIGSDRIWPVKQSFVSKRTTARGRPRAPDPSGPNRQTTCRG